MTVKLNTDWLLPLYLLLGAIFLPYKLMFLNGIPVWVGTLFILLYMVFKLKIINREVIVFLLFFSILVFSLFPLSEDLSSYFSFIIDYIKFAIIPCVLVFYISDISRCLRYFTYFSTISLVMLVVSLRWVTELDFNYMTYGYYLAVTSIPFIMNVLSGERSLVFNMTAIALSLFLMFFFGNRGSIAMVIMPLFFAFLVTDKFSIQKKNVGFIILIALSVIAVKYAVPFLLYAQDLSSEMGYSPYTIIKVLSVLEGNSSLSDSSSGRDSIYRIAFDALGNRHFLPNGVEYFKVLTSARYEYPHNIFLELGLVFGFIGPILLCVFFFYTFFFYLSSVRNIYKVFFTVFIFSALGRLLLSGSFFIEPLLWVSIGVLLSSKLKFK